MLLLFGTGLHAAAQELSLALVPASSSAPLGSTAAIDVLVVNRSTATTQVSLGEQLAASLSIGNRSWPISLVSQSVAQGSAQLAPGAFLSRRYTLKLPSDAQGRVVLEVAVPEVGTARTAIDVAEPARASAATPQVRASAFQAERTLGGQLSVYEPTYFIVGADQPLAKFQVSFKYRLLSFDEADGPQPAHSLQLAYTQRSLWEFHSFYDTSYMPSLMYQWFATDTVARSDVNDVTWLGLQSGWRHESNGRGGDLERSLNVAFVRPLFSIGSPQGWHVVLAPELWAYVGGLADNPDLYRYRGYGQVRALLGKGNGASLLLTLVPGERFEYGSQELDLSIPVTVARAHSSIFLLLQYFNGYGESLIGYNQHTSSLRAGIELVR